MGRARELAELATGYDSGGSINFRNRIINGDMRIDQRNAGAAVTVNNSNSVYSVDRWAGGDNGAAVFTLQQDSSAPTGFVNSLKATVTTADATIDSGDYSAVAQQIEGTNVADLAWGTANAKTVTLSFWTRSSLTGTFGGSLRNSAADRSYPFNYTISVADTWEYKTVTVPGDTTGTWLTTTGTGLSVTFSLGVGTDFSGTAGAWTAANRINATGSVAVVSTLNATWYITGVQLEVGSVATPFERRPYGTELSLCQRYFQPFRSTYEASLGLTGSITGATTAFNTAMRASPTMTVTVQAGSGTSLNSMLLNGSTATGFYSYAMALTISTSGYAYRYVTGTASAEL